MNLTPQEIRYIRLHKQGLITPFETLPDLFKTLEIQAQSENDAYFNVNIRLKNKVTIEEIQRYAIRLWYIRNTIFLLDRKAYDKVVYVNRLIDNWFHRSRIKTPEDEAEIQNMIKICKDKDFVMVDDLVTLGCNESFIRVWSGAFIEMTRRGILKSRYKKQLEINHDEIRQDFSLKDIMISYFNVYGPATLNDFKHWFGRTSSEIKETFESIRQQFITVNENMLLSPSDLELLQAAGETELPLMILGKFDSICLSYHDKSWLLAQEHLPKVWGKAGIVEAVILWKGEIVATWRKDSARITVFAIRKLPKGLQQKIKTRFRKLFGRQIEVNFTDRKP